MLLKTDKLVIRKAWMKDRLQPSTYVMRQIKEGGGKPTISARMPKVERAVVILLRQIDDELVEWISEGSFING